ncbi:MAG: cohesin loading factor [Benniella sp.]|nr:MAG: cohesin loading factor [Benniella sp.]
MTGFEPSPTSLADAAMSQKTQSFIAQGKTHLVLWGLAEEYIDQARSLCFVATTQPNAQVDWRKRHHDLIFCAIKCLVASISTASHAMTQLDKAKAGLRLAQILFEETENLQRAEEEINKAITIVDAIQGSSALDIQLRLYELRIQIYIETKRFRLAKNALRIATTEAAKHELYWWRYQFCFLKARVHFLMSDIAGSLSALNQGATLADERGDFDLKLAFWIVAGQYSLMLSNWDQAMRYLQKLIPHMGLDEKLALSSGAPSSASSSLSVSAKESGSSTSTTGHLQLCQSKQLRVFFLILYITCTLRSGSVAQSLAALSTLHAALDETRPKDAYELQGIFRIPLKARPNQGDHNRGSLYYETWPHISIKWMSFSQVYCLTYLLSGICNKADMTQPTKAEQFLVEGIKAVDREFSVNDYETSTIHVRRNQRWFSLLMMTMLLHLTDVFLIKYNLVAAEDTILKATYWSKVCGTWEAAKWRISLSIGMLMQLSGRLEEALEWYNICNCHSEENHRDPEGYEAKTLAIINMALIHCGDRLQDLEKVSKLQLEARARHATCPSTNVLCALHILDSRVKEGLIPVRQHLQEALRLSSALMNTQMRSLTLLLLGDSYMHPHDEQAEKMLMAGYVHAVKTSNQIVAAAAGSCLKELYLATSQGIKASQQAQKNTPILETIDQAFQTRLMGPLLHE